MQEDDMYASYDKVHSSVDVVNMCHFMLSS